MRLVFLLFTSGIVPRTEIKNYSLPLLAGQTKVCTAKVAGEKGKRPHAGQEIQSSSSPAMRTAMTMKRATLLMIFSMMI